MTVLYAFASPSRRHSVICADDLEGHTQRRVDKITIAFDRYAVAITGADFLKDALTCVSYFDRRVRRRGSNSASVPPNSVEKLATAVARTLPRWASFHSKRMDQCVQEEKVTPEQAGEWRRGSGSLVVLDLREHQLHVAELPCSVEDVARANPAHLNFRITALPPDTVYEFSGPPQQRGPVPVDAYGDHRKWGAVMVDKFAVDTNPRYPQPVIGGLGASVEARKSQWEMWSALDGPEELLKAHGID